MDVEIRCPCPAKADGKPRHDTDTVTLRATLDFRRATSIRNAAGEAKIEDPDISTADMLAVLTESYLLHGIEAWTLRDAKGQPIPVSKPAIRDYLLADPVLAEPVADAADDLYNPVIVLPLVRRALASLQPSPTDESTSPTTTSRRKRPRPSKPSSTSTSQTAGTATISPLRAGGFSSSPNSATAA